jgi:hypothetical protein
MGAVFLLQLQLAIDVSLMHSASKRRTGANSAGTSSGWVRNNPRTEMHATHASGEQQPAL